MMRAWSQAASAALVRPQPSQPKKRARLSPSLAPRPGASMGRASSVSARALSENPRARSSSAQAAGHAPASTRVHGTWKTVPMETRTARRQSGSAQRGERSTASAPSAAADRKSAPTLVTSTRSSNTTTLRAPSRSSATPRSAGRRKHASRPRVTLKPHRRSSCSWGSTKTGTSSGARAKRSAAEARWLSSTRKESGSRPWASATSMTFLDSATSIARSGSRRLLSWCSVRRA